AAAIKSSSNSTHSQARLERLGCVDGSGPGTACCTAGPYDGGGASACAALSAGKAAAGAGAGGRARASNPLAGSVAANPGGGGAGAWKPGTGALGAGTDGI